MGRRTDLLIGSLFTLLFVGLGLTILGFNGRSIAQSLDSKSWPTVPGRVQASGTHEAKVLVRYVYEVEGRRHESTRIGFDVFDNPGGRGRAQTLLDRYPVGAAVDVHVRPRAPEQAVLETGDVAPFFTPLVFGLIFFGSGLYFGRVTILRSRGAVPTVPVEQARRVVSTLISIALALIFAGLGFEANTQEVVYEALGPWIPAGVPPWIATLAFVFVFAAWLPLLIWHGVILIGEGVRPKPLAMVVAASSGPAGARRSARWALAALLYFVVTCSAWIAFASWRGL